MSRMALLGAGGSGDVPVEPTYLFRDIFDDTTPEVGSWATITDTLTKYSVAGGALVIASGVNVNQTDPQRYTATMSHAAGLAFYARMDLMDTSVTNGGLGLSSAINANPVDPFSWFGAHNRFYPQIGGTQADTNIVLGDQSTNYVRPLKIETLIICRNPGALWFQRFTPGAWTLVWVDHLATDANVRVRIAGIGKPYNIDEVAAFTLPAPYTNRNALVTNRIATTVNGDTTTMVADGIVQHTITAATGVVQEVMIRRTDDSNCLIIRCSQTGGTVKLIQVVAGVETELASASQTWTNGTVYTIEVHCQHYNVRVHVNKTFKIAYTSARLHYTATGVKVSHAGTELATWARKHIINISGYSTSVFPKAFLPYGDSKTNGQGDSTATYPLGQNAYPPQLCDLLTTATGQSWHEFPRRIAVSSTTVALRKAAIDADLAQRGDAPNYVLLNLGVNDMAGALVEATWKADYQYILDTLHTRWPNALVLLAIPWRASGQVTTANTMATWIATLVATNSSFCALGPDERVILEGGDNGATYTSDGIHPTAAGHTAMAVAWQAAIAAAGY